MSHYVPLKGASPLWQWLQKIEPAQGSLAWCHTTDAYALRRIIQTGHFTPQECKVFGEQLLYFFYGRPAFRRTEHEAIGLTAKSPVVAILRSNLINSGRRLFPFDSGAFEDRYKQWLHKDMKLQDFELNCVTQAPNRHVKAFYGSNTSYLQLHSIRPTEPYNGEFEVESIVALMTDPRIEQADDRRLAIELQIPSNTKFDSSTVLALIVPDELTAAAWFTDFLKGDGANIKIQTYKMQRLKQAIEYQASLENTATELQNQLGIV